MTILKAIKMVAMALEKIIQKIRHKLLELVATLRYQTPKIIVGNLHSKLLALIDIFPLLNCGQCFFAAIFSGSNSLNKVLIPDEL